MVWIAGFCFACYGILLLWDRLGYHAQRAVGRQERAARWLFALNLVGIAAYQLLVRPGGLAFGGFGALCALATVLTLVAESDRHSQVGGAERGLHALIAMVTPPILILLGLVWNFIDGAGFFLRLVLPVSMKHLREVTWGVAAYACVLLIVESAGWWRAARAVRMTAPGEVYGPPEPAAEAFPKAS